MSTEWADEFALVGLKFRFNAPYRGQSDFFQALIENRLRKTEVVVEPTGYGKTDQQALQAAYLHKTGQIDNAAAFVPKDNLRTSFVDLWRQILLDSGLNESSFVVLNGSRDLSRVKRYLGKRFVVIIFCYQQLPDVVISDLIQSGRWLVIADEAHHLYQEGRWAQYVSLLKSHQTTYYTATPYRGDKKALHGAPYKLVNGIWQIDPIIEMTARQAQQEKALIRLNLTVFKYWIDMIDADGTEKRIYSDDLSEEDAKDFEAYETRKQLRFKPGYLHPMIRRMIDLYYRKNDKHPYKHQVLVKAMSNAHAEHLCAEINAYIGDDDFAHWVGIRRPEQENSQLLARFQGKELIDGSEIDIPDYERFPCLVQVDMAGEGYNNPYISIGCKADLTRNPPTILQLIGRMLRRNYKINDYDAEKADLLVSSDDVATIELVQNSYEIEGKIKDETTDGVNGRDDWLPSIPSIDVIQAQFDHAFTVSDGDSYHVSDEEVTSWVKRHEPDLFLWFSMDKLRQMYLDAASSSPVRRPQARGSAGVSGDMVYWQQQTQRALKTVTGTVMKLLPSNSYPLNGNNSKEIAGQVKRLINGRWLWICGRKVEERTPEEEQEKYAWLKELSEEMRQTRQVPSWILTKLR